MLIIYILILTLKLNLIINSLFLLVFMIFVYILEKPKKNIVNIKIINKSKNTTPTYSTKNSAGLDLRANTKEEIILKPMSRRLIKTGFLFSFQRGLKRRFDQEVAWRIKTE